MDMFDSRSAGVMLAGGESPAFDDPGYVFELKLDGDRCLAYLDAGKTVLINRHSRYVNEYFPELENIHKQVADRCILDGELVIGSGRKHDFARLRSRLGAPGLAKQNPGAKLLQATFLAFDVLYRGDRDTLELPLLERKAILDAIVSEGPRLATSRFIPERGKDFFTLVAEQGLEGVMAKRADSVYRMGKRSKDWVKCKNWDRDAFVVCGYMPSEKANVVSLILGQYEDGALRYVGHVVLGRKADAYALLAAQPEAGASLALPPEEARNRDRITWVVPNLVCQVEFICRTASGGFRQPVFKGMLPDVAPGGAVWPEVLSCSD